MLKERIFVIPLVAILAVLTGVGIQLNRNKIPKYDFVIAEKADIVQEVSVTGKIKPARDVNLAFEKGGKIASVNVKIGDKVFAGQNLVSVENGELLAQLAQTEANTRVQQAKLDELRRGTRAEEIRLQEVKVANTGVAINEAKQNLNDKLQDAFTKAEDGVRTKTDQFFSNPRYSGPQLTFPINDSELEITLEFSRIKIEELLGAWASSLNELNVSSDLGTYLKTAEAYLGEIKTFLNKAALAVGYAAPSPTLSQSTINGWRSDVSTARTNLNTAIINLSTAEENLKTAESNLALAEQELILKKAGAAPDEIKAQEARVEEAQANSQNIKAQILKTVISSPLNGIVTKQEARIGEIFGVNEPVVSIISAAKFQIEANIPEADIAKVKFGNEARATLDAYGSDVVFEAVVIAIEPAETVIDGLATYKTTLEFLKEDERIRSGMTANIDIVSAEKRGVIVLPQRALQSKNGNRYVRILAGQNIEEREVKTGLRGFDGNIEILSGLTQGEKVIIGARKK